MNVSNTPSTKKILFVCLGNICRSPTAESIFRKQIDDCGLSSQVMIDSAGTSNYHVGETSNSQMIKHATQRGYEMTHRARVVTPQDFEEFDMVIGMDNHNINNLKQICPSPTLLSKLHKMTNFCVHSTSDIVPDPYGGTARDFEIVIEILEDACEGLLQEIKSQVS